MSNSMKKGFLIRVFAVVSALLVSLSLSAYDGVWNNTPEGFPYCKVTDAGEGIVMGNHRTKVVAQADGTYQILSGERVWAGFNADPLRPGYGKNRAAVIQGNVETQLIGPGVRSEVYTGVGFTRYDYRLADGLVCSRTISVVPSDKVNGGESCFVITVTFTNTGRGTRKVGYEESFFPMYVPVDEVSVPAAERVMAYPMYTEISFRCLKGFFAPTAQKFVKTATPDVASRYEFAPQSVFLYAENAFLSISEGEFMASFSDIKVRAGRKQSVHIVVGLSGDKDVRPMAERVLAQAGDAEFGIFEPLWKNRLPDYTFELNPDLRRKKYMDSYSLESLAVYDGYFKDTCIPGEDSEVFRTGVNLSCRESLLNAWPLCHSNPELVKSVLRYVMKHADYAGRIYGGDAGFGYIRPSYSAYYDIHIHLFNLLAEYFDLTGDYGFLDERLYLYPAEGGEYLTVMQVLERCFVYLRDEIPSEADPASLEANRELADMAFPYFISKLEESGKASDLFLKALEEYADSASGAAK